MTAKKVRKINRNGFGSVRVLPSGRVQARCRDESGAAMSAPFTFETVKAAREWLAGVQADRSRGQYVDHRGGQADLQQYVERWIETGGTRGRLAPRTRDGYLDLAANLLFPEPQRAAKGVPKRPSLRGVALGELDADRVRSWYAETAKYLAATARYGDGSVRLRQGYQLLRSTMNAAVTAKKVPSNPCVISGAGTAARKPRSAVSIADLALIAEHLPEHLRVAMPTLLGGHVRLGEVLGLQRGDVDLVAGTLRIERQHVDVRHVDDDGRARIVVQVTAPKGGKPRTVDLPASTVEALRAYLDSLPRGFAREPLFRGRNGLALTRSAVEQAWRRAVRRAGLDGVHLHDVRATGLTAAAIAGATLAELQERGGHSTTQAAMVYQRVAQSRRSEVAMALDTVLNARSGGSSGTQVARTDTASTETA